MAPTETSAARSATLRPCLAVVCAARTLAWAASRVSFAAIVRARRPVDFDGAFAERALAGRDAARVVLVLRAVLRFAGFGLVVEVVVVSAMWINPLCSHCIELRN